MNQKRVILIVTILLVIGTVVGGTTLLSMLQANAQGVTTGKSNQAASAKAEIPGLPTTFSEDKDTNKMSVLSPNAFFDVQH